MKYPLARLRVYFALTSTFRIRDISAVGGASDRLANLLSTGGKQYACGTESSVVITAARTTAKPAGAWASAAGVEASVPLVARALARHHARSFLVWPAISSTLVVCGESTSR